MRSSRLVTVLATVCLLAAGAGCGSPGAGDENKSVELNFASYIGQSAPQSQAAEWWADQVEKRSDGRIKVKSTYQEALLKAADILGGVSDGRADLGYISNAYYPAELPLSSVIEVPFTTANAEAQARALQELYATSSEFQAEWSKQGARPLYFPAIGSNIIATRKPMKSVSDLSGKSIRGLGLINSALKEVGANPVAIAAPEIYEALQRGVIDGFSGFAFEVIPALKLQEVAPYVLDSGLGEYTAAIVIMNEKKYESLPQDLQTIVDQVSKEVVQKSIELLEQSEDTTCKAIKDTGGAVTRLSQSDVAKWKATMGNTLVDGWAEDRGSSNFYNSYVNLVKKYDSQSDYVPGVERCADAN